MVDAVLDAEIAREAHVAEPVVHEADVDVVVALELGDDLPEGIVLEAEAAVDPVDRAFGRGAVGQAHGVRPGVENQLLRRVQAHRGLLASRSIGLDGAFEQDGGDTVLVVVVADVETCAEDFDVQAVGRHDERRPAVVLDLEIGFTLHLHAALARKERGNVLHAAR